MPLPLFLAIAAGVAAATGVGAGVKGALDMADAKDTIARAQKRDEENQRRQKAIDERTVKTTDDLGRLEMNILASFKTFSDVIEHIKSRPSIEEIKPKINIPEFNFKELEQASIGASILVGGLGSAVLGTAGGFAASGATTAAVMALGTASTGTAISSLTGVAATNATLAALGGGSLAAGGGGMALGSAILGGATLGVGLLVGGIIFSLAGSNISEKADEAYSQMLKNEKTINKICAYLEDLNDTASLYQRELSRVNRIYEEQFDNLKYIVKRNQNNVGNVEWDQLLESEKKTVKNTVMLVGLLYNMCKVKLVNKTYYGDKLNTVNHADINEALNNSRKVQALISA